MVAQCKSIGTQTQHFERGKRKFFAFAAAFAPDRERESRGRFIC